jgi:hypothetical protein
MCKYICIHIYTFTHIHIYLHIHVCIFRLGKTTRIKLLFLTAAASNQESFAGSSLSGSIPQPQPLELEIVIEVVQPVQLVPTYYFFGGDGIIDRVNSMEIKRSTYVPNITPYVLAYLAALPNADNLYLLGVKYEDEIGGDIQAGIAESSLINESRIKNALRGITEELHIRLARGVELQTFGKYYNHTHYHAELGPRDYSLVDISNINPNPSLDDKSSRKGKASVYLYGTFATLEPILRRYQPPNGRKDHDKIEKLCAIPFSDLHMF